MCEPRDEWAYRFELSTTELTETELRKQTEKLMLEVIVPWAELHQYGIGGGFRLLGGEGAPSVTFRAAFGMCATRPEQLLPPGDCDELMGVIREFARVNRLECEGGWRAYRDDEFDHIQERPEDPD